ITSSSGLSKDDVEKLVHDAESHAEEDKKRREEIEAKNQLDSLVYQVEKMLSENRDKISGADVQNLENAITEARKAMEQGGIDNLRRATDTLTKASHKLAEVMYAQAGDDPHPHARPRRQSRRRRSRPQTRAHDARSRHGVRPPPRLHSPDHARQAPRHRARERAGQGDAEGVDEAVVALAAARPLTR